MADYCKYPDQGLGETFVHPAVQSRGLVVVMSELGVIHCPIKLFIDVGYLLVEIAVLHIFVKYNTNSVLYF